MTPLGPTPPVTSGAIAAAGSVSTGAPERTAKLDAAAHSLAAGRRDLAPQRIEGDAHASADRDADGWTGNTHDGRSQGEPSAEAAPAPPEPGRPRLPDDPRGGGLDVSV